MVVKKISFIIIFVSLVFIFFNEYIANSIEFIDKYLPYCTIWLRDLPDKLFANKKFMLCAALCSIFSAIWGDSLLGFLKSKYKEIFDFMHKSETMKSCSPSNGGFDILLCYQDENKEEVEKIENDIKKAGYKSWSKHSLPAGTRWKDKLKKDINNIKSAALFVGEGGDWPWETDRELWKHIQKISTNRPIIPVILKSCKRGHNDPPALVEEAITVDFNSDSEPLKKLLNGIPVESGIDVDDNNDAYRGDVSEDEYYENKQIRRRELPRNPYLQIESVITESSLQICIKSNFGIETSLTEVDLNHHFFSELARGIRFYPISEDWIDSANLLGVELMKSLTDKNKDIAKAYNEAIRWIENENTEKMRLHFR